MIVDIEKVLGDYLRAHGDVTALSTRVVGRTPDSVTTSWVRVTMLDASSQPGSRADHLVPYLVQLDCYAGKAGIDGSPQKEASLIARTVRAALAAMPGTHGDAVVTSVRFVGFLRLPDGDIEPARERIIITAAIHAHPAV